MSPDALLAPYFDLKPALWAARAVEAWLTASWRDAGGATYPLPASTHALPPKI